MTFHAVPDRGQIFLGWDGGIQGTNPSVTVILTNSLVVIGRFSQKAELAFPSYIQSVGPLEDVPLWLTGAWGGIYQIQASAAVTGPWSLQANVTNQFGRTQILLPRSGRNESIFYRAVGPLEPLPARAAPGE